MSGLPRFKGISLAAILFELFPWALLCALFVAVGIMHVTSRVLVVDLGYKLSRLEQEGRGLTREHDRLKLELATHKSPAKLEQIARERLNMAPPAAGAVLNVPFSPPTTAGRPAALQREQGG